MSWFGDLEIKNSTKIIDFNIERIPPNVEMTKEILNCHRCTDEIWKSKWVLSKIPPIVGMQKNFWIAIDALIHGCKIWKCVDLVIWKLSCHRCTDETYVKIWKNHR